MPPSADQVREQIRAMLLGDAAYLVLGVITIAAGLTAISLYRARRSRDPALIWFSAFALLYGTRLVFQTGTAGFLTGIPPLFWRYAIAAITYVVPLPALFFGWQFFPEWRRWLQWMILVDAAFALIGIITDQILTRPASLQTANNVFAIALLSCLLVALYLRPNPTREVWAL